MDSTMADDTLQGAMEIAFFIGKSERQAQYLLEAKLLPAFKIGGKWHLRKSTYRAYIERLEADASKAA